MMFVKLVDEHGFRRLGFFWTSGDHGHRCET